FGRTSESRARATNHEAGRKRPGPERLSLLRLRRRREPRQHDGAADTGVAKRRASPTVGPANDPRARRPSAEPPIGAPARALEVQLDSLACLGRPAPPVP